MSSENDLSSDNRNSKLNITEQVLDEAAIKQAIESNQPKKPGILRTVFVDFGRKTHWASTRQGFKPHLSNIKAMLSPICPLCGKSILMCDNRIPNKFKGNVIWQCGNPICDYQIIAPHNFNKLKKQIANTSYSLGQRRINQLSAAEREALVASHLRRAKLFLSLMGLMAIYAIYMTFKATHFIFLPPVYLFTCAFYLWSTAAAYRAWQMKTGLLFLPNSPFLAWYRYAPKKYNLDWFDGQHPLPIEILDKLENQKKSIVLPDED